MAADLKVQTSSASNLYLLRKDMSGWARNRAVRATVGDLSDEERQELWECYQAVTSDGKEMDWVGLTKAADAVLGPGNYSTSKLRTALQQMDLNRNGTINWYEFRAYMSANWSASKTAEHIMNSQDCEEDMITVDGKTRVVDLIKHYRRRVMMECVLKGQTAGFTQYKSQQYEFDGSSMPQVSSKSRRPTEDSCSMPTANSYAGHSAGALDANLDEELADIAAGPSLYQQVLGGTALAFDLSTKGGLDCSGATPRAGRRSLDLPASPAPPPVPSTQREKRQLGKNMSFRHHRTSSGYLHEALDSVDISADSTQLLSPDCDIFTTRDSVCPSQCSELDSLTEFMGTNLSAHSQASQGSAPRRLPARKASNLGNRTPATQGTSFRVRRSSGTGLSFLQETALNAALHSGASMKEETVNYPTQKDAHMVSSNGKLPAKHSLPLSPAMGESQTTSKLGSAVQKVGSFFNKVSNVLFHPSAATDATTFATQSGVDAPNHPSLSTGGALITAVPKAPATAMERAKSFNGLYSNGAARGNVNMKSARSLAREDAKWH